MHPLVAAIERIPSEPSKLARDGSTISALVLVGAAALLFIGYLALDWLKTRREARKLARKKQAAREAWQQELENNRK